MVQVEELETSVRKLMREKEELRQVLEEQDEQASITLQEETQKLRVQNQELQHKVLSLHAGPRFLRTHLGWGLSSEVDCLCFQLSELQVQGQEVQKLTQEQQNLKTKLSELETARTQAQDQVSTTCPRILSPPGLNPETGLTL